MFHDECWKLIYKSRKNIAGVSWVDLHSCEYWLLPVYSAPYNFQHSNALEKGNLILVWGIMAPVLHLIRHAVTLTVSDHLNPCFIDQFRLSALYYTMLLVETGA